jgi:hypothetical protein
MFLIRGRRVKLSGQMVAMLKPGPSQKRIWDRLAKAVYAVLPYVWLDVPLAQQHTCSLHSCSIANIYTLSWGFLSQNQ